MCSSRHSRSPLSPSADFSFGPLTLETGHDHDRARYTTKRAPVHPRDTARSLTPTADQPEGTAHGKPE